MTDKTERPTAEAVNRAIKRLAHGTLAARDFYRRQGGHAPGSPQPLLYAPLEGLLDLLGSLPGVPVAFHSQDVKGIALYHTGSEDELITALRKEIARQKQAKNNKPCFDPDLSRLCESPIESAFYDIAAHLHHDSKNDAFRPIPQYQHGPYRLDFAFPDEKLAVELDGHDYHKTKEQRTADARRDRKLTADGWTTVRFTGSEIWADTVTCVLDVYDLFQARRVEG